MFGYVFYGRKDTTALFSDLDIQTDAKMHPCK